MSFRPENPSASPCSAYLQDVWLPSCNLKFRWQGLFYIRIIKFIVGTTLGWGNFGLGQLWARPTLIWANYVWGNFGPANFGPGNNGWGNFELIPRISTSAQSGCTRETPVFWYRFLGKMTLFSMVFYGSVSIFRNQNKL